MIGRALVLRCPRCGGRGIRRSWFKFKHGCPTCDLALERGESEDYWLGAYMFNLVAAELVSVGIAVVVIVSVCQRCHGTSCGRSRSGSRSQCR